jgi:myosin heavy subunit
MEARLPESQKALREARKQAQRIIEEAQKQVRKDARKKTKAQVNKILAKARQEAEAYAEKARKTVEQERAVTMEAARAQVEDTLKAITEQARQQSQAKSQQILAEAQARADHLMREVTEASAEVSKQVKDVIERARGTINEFEERLQNETEGITHSIEETQARLEAMAQAAAEEAARNARPEPQSRTEQADAPVMVVRVLGERSNGRNGSQPLFFGMVETIAPPETCDYRYFKSMKRFLVSVPGIKQLQESASEKELSALFDVTEPLPLLELLSKVPQVEEVVSRSDRDIAVVFEKPS